MARPITGSMLYDLIQCPHRVAMDLFADPAERDPVSPFVQLLWERGTLFEAEVLAGLTPRPVLVTGLPPEERERATLDAIARRAPLICGGRLSADNLLGEPDVLRLEAGGYVAGDIKSGAGLEGGGNDEPGKPKKHYAVQVALYTDLLEQLGYSAGRRGFIWDVHGAEIPYDLEAPSGVRSARTLWDDYQEALAQARAIVSRTTSTLPAYGTVCKQCMWYSACLRQLEAADDLTLLPELGRARRDVMPGTVSTVHELANADMARFSKGKKTLFAGIGKETLARFHTRAKLCVSGGSPFLRRPVHLPNDALEVFLDLEADPFRDLCYLHGFLLRENGESHTEAFTGFFAEEASPEAEAQAFREAWAFLESSRPCALYFYSAYERTMYRRLCRRHPGICTEAEVEALFTSPGAVDLYTIVRRDTEWPTRDYSIKTLAKYLGFRWRDPDPSGAASIEWFSRWAESRDPALRERILAYNEDDCRATRVLLDRLRELPIRLDSAGDAANAPQALLQGRKAVD